MTKKGKRRIRLLGKGSDKALIMVTLCITEAGDDFPVQYIFGEKRKDVILKQLYRKVVSSVIGHLIRRRRKL